MALKKWEWLFTFRRADNSLAIKEDRRNKAVFVLLLLASLSLPLGIILPIIKISNFLIFSQKISILQELAHLLRGGDLLLALTVFIFSIAVPATKLVLADYAWRGLPVKNVQLHKHLERLEWIGRWSMTEVMVVAMVVVIARASLFGEADIGPGLYFFAASAACAALAINLIKRMALEVPSPTITPVYVNNQS